MQTCKPLLTNRHKKPPCCPETGNKEGGKLKKENYLSFLGGSSFGCRLFFAYIGMAQSMPIIVYCKKRYCLLFIVYCLLFIVYCSLSIVRCSLFIVYWHSLHHDKVKGEKKYGEFL